jgi:hypothetical protein
MTSVTIMVNIEALTPTSTEVDRHSRKFDSFIGIKQKQLSTFSQLLLNEKLFKFTLLLGL